MNLNKMNQFVDNSDVEKLLAMREAKSHLKKRLDLLANSINELEAELIEQVSESAYTERFQLAVRSSEKRFPAWKEHFISLAGKTEADAVLEATEPKIYKSLIIKAA